jgi:hypothetical protein
MILSIYLTRAQYSGMAFLFFELGVFLTLHILFSFPDKEGL